MDGPTTGAGDRQIHDSRRANRFMRRKKNLPQRPFDYRLTRWQRLRLAPLFLARLAHGVQLKRSLRRISPPRPSGGRGGGVMRLLGMARSFVRFLREYADHERHCLARAWLTLCCLAERGERRLALFGCGQAAWTLFALTRFLPLQISGACPFDADAADCPGGAQRLNMDELRNFPGPIVIAAFVNTAYWLRELEAAGIPRERCVVLE